MDVHDQPLPVASDVVMPDLTTPSKRVVIQHTDGMMQIIGVASAQPATMIAIEQCEALPLGAVCLTQAKHRFYVYKPLMVPATGNHDKPFHKEQR